MGKVSLKACCLTLIIAVGMTISASAFYATNDGNKKLNSGTIYGTLSGNEGYAQASTRYDRNSGSGTCFVYVEACVGSYQVLKSGSAQSNAYNLNVPTEISGFQATEHHSSHGTSNQYEQGMGLMIRVQ